jgi:hypothetical protein
VARQWLGERRAQGMERLDVKRTASVDPPDRWQVTLAGRSRNGRFANYQ